MQFPLPHLISTPRALTPVGQRLAVFEMGGAITVDSVVGQGSTFCVKLRRVAHVETELSTSEQASEIEMASTTGAESG